MNINDLSIEYKIGQRFIMGVNGYNIQLIIDLVKNYHIGGVILYKKNYRSYDEMLKVIRRLKEVNKGNAIPLFIAIDQEGGKVNRLPSEIHNLKNIYDVSKKDKTLIGSYSNTINNILVESGINMNLAPVVDIFNNSKSKALYKRCFYGNYQTVCECARDYINAAKKNKIISVIKHFPGHGSSKHDSHFLIPYIFKINELKNIHMMPFNNLMHDADAIMVGHMIVRGETGLLPASLSDKFMDKYLRQSSYDKLIMTDEINMLKRHLIYRFIYKDMALKSLNDIILVKIKNYNEGVNFINRYKKILSKDKMLLDKLDDSVKRIINIKKQYDISDNMVNGINVDDINKVIDKINDKI